MLNVSHIKNIALMDRSNLLTCARNLIKFPYKDMKNSYTTDCKINSSINLRIRFLQQFIKY